MPRKNKAAAEPLFESPALQHSEVTIARIGDILLDIKDQRTETEYQYRCSRKILRNSSEYFNVLLDPIKFSEGIKIEAQLQELYKQHDESIPSSRLPIITIADLGEIPKADVLMNTTVRLFLKILHDPSTPWPVSRSHSVNLVALLAIVADRFAAHKLIAAYLTRHALDITLLKDRKSATACMSEAENRQKLLAGMIFGFPQWVLQCSAALIMDGPKRWTNTHLESNEEADKDDDDALWWRLPGGVEEEISCRREYVLETLGSIQKHFIALYTSRQPQCRLGYSSSPNCDSYQLGEIIRFFSRKGLLRVESAFAATLAEEPEPYNISIDNIIAKLRECPGYQIDHNHSHCGLRTRLMPILDSLWPLNQVWICLECWRADKSKESWLDNPSLGRWTWLKKNKVTGGCQAHRDAKAMYTAEKRDWTPGYSV